MHLHEFGILFLLFFIFIYLVINSISRHGTSKIQHFTETKHRFPTKQVQRTYFKNEFGKKKGFIKLKRDYRLSVP